MCAEHHGTGVDMAIIDQKEIPTVDIIIPVYNEEQILKQAVDKLHNFLLMQKYFEWRIVIASNGSTDRTNEIGINLSRNYSRVSFFHITKKGRGRALRKAFGESKALICLYTDVDLSVDIHLLPVLIRYAVEHGAITMPNRLAPRVYMKRPLNRVLFSRIYNVLIKFLFPTTTIKDAQVGMKAIHRNILEALLKNVKNDNFFFDTELLLLAERAGYPIIQISADCCDMRAGNVRLVSCILEEFIGLIKMRIRLMQHKNVNTSKVLARENSG